MSSAPVTPFLLVGEPAAASCEGDFCAVPQVPEQVATPEGRDQDQDQDQDPSLSPAGEGAAPLTGS